MKIKPLYLFYCLFIFFLLPFISYKANAQVDTMWQRVWSLYQNKKFDSALVGAEQLRQKTLESGHDSYRIKAISVIAKAYRKQGKIEESVLTLYDLLETGKKLNDPGAQGSAYSILGRIFYDAYDYNMAVYYLKKADEQYELANKPNNQGIALYHIARSFLKKKLPDSAFYFLNKALIVNPPKYKELTSSIYNLLGWVSFEKKNYSEARNHYCRSLEYADSSRKKHAIAYHNIGETYLAEGNFNESKLWFERALKIKKDLNNPAFTLSTINLLAKLYEQGGNTPGALNLLNNGLVAVDQKEISEEAMDALTLMSELISKHPQISLSSSGLESYLTTYRSQYLALKNQKVTLAESSSRHQIQAIARAYALKKKAGLEKEKTLYRIGGIAIATLIILVVPLLIKQNVLRKNYKKEKKLMAYTAERLQESLLINDSLKKNYKEIYKKFKSN